MTNWLLSKLSKSNIETLKTLPETGMGYQLIKTGNNNYVNQKLIVLNGQLAISENALKYRNIIKAIINTNFKKALQQAREVDLKIFDVVSSAKQLDFLVLEENYTQQKSAKDSAKENANGDELFVRLSAFEDDIRIDKTNKCLLPGSFATMASDALRCKTEKDNAVERYALPTDLDIQWAYYLQPFPKDILQRGTVEQAFGKRGGGREAFFENGTSSLTFITQTPW